MAITPVLKNKILEIKDYSSEPLAIDEISELGNLISDTDADIEERILAAKVMLNVAMNRKLRAERQVKHFSEIHSSLVHKNEQQKASDTLVRDGSKLLENVEGAEQLLEALLHKIKGGR